MPSSSIEIAESTVVAVVVVFASSEAVAPVSSLVVLAEVAVSCLASSASGTLGSNLQRRWKLKNTTDNDAAQQKALNAKLSSKLASLFFF